jgi:D-alanine-D-alanine ligase
MRERVQEDVEPPSTLPPLFSSTTSRSHTLSPQDLASPGAVLPMHRKMRFPALLQNWPFATVGLLVGDPKRPDAVKPGKHFQPDDLSDLATTTDVLGDIGLNVTLFQDHAALIDGLQTLSTAPDAFVINFCDNGYGNDPLKELHIPALLEVMGIRYSGAAPAALARCYDKFSVGRTADGLGIPAPREQVIWPQRDRLETVVANWGIFPAFLKLNAADNSFGIMPESLVRAPAELEDALALFYSLYPDRAILLQEFLSGREYRLCLLGNRATGFMFLPIAERTFANADNPYVTYYYKYNPLAEQASPAFRSRPCSVGAEKQEWLQNACIKLFEYFGCRDYATFDFREDASGTPRILDVNPNPSWDKNSMVSVNDEAAGYFYPDVLRFVIASAQARYVG